MVCFHGDLSRMTKNLFGTNKGALVYNNNQQKVGWVWEPLWSGVGDGEWMNGWMDGLLSSCLPRSPFTVRIVLYPPSFSA